MRPIWLILLLASCGCMAAGNSQLLLTTENYPPFNMSLDDGKTVIGISTEQVQHALKRSGLSGKIVLYPWARAFRLALEQADTCVFSTTRTALRETQFKWVGPLVDNDWVLYARSDNPRVIKHLNDARPYLIGGYLGDAVSEYLHGEGFRVEDAVADHHNARKLAARRIDYWATGKLLGAYLAQQEKVGPFKPVLTFQHTQMYLACNLSVSDEIIGKLNQALRSMQQDGSVARIHARYMEKPKR